MDMNAELMKVLIEESGKLLGNVECESTDLSAVYFVCCGMDEGYAVLKNAMGDLLPPKAFEFGIPIAHNRIYLFMEESKEIVGYALAKNRLLNERPQTVETYEETRACLCCCKMDYPVCFGQLPPPSVINELDIVEDFVKVDNGLYFVLSSSGETLFAVQKYMAEPYLTIPAFQYGFPQGSKGSMVDYLFFHWLEFFIPLYDFCVVWENDKVKQFIADQQLMLAYLNREKQSYVREYNALSSDGTCIPKVEADSQNYTDALNAKLLPWLNS